MRCKKTLSVVAFIAAFGLSAAFASLFAVDRQIENLYSTVNAPESVQDHKFSGTSCFTHRNNSSVADKITAFIAQDKRNGDESGSVRYEGEASIFSSDDSTIGDYAAAVRNYIVLSNDLRTGDLPSDFQAKWYKHLDAWRDYSNFLNRMERLSNRAAVSDKELKAIDAFHGREIERTFNDVQEIGESYGADVR